jgi:CO/xanthine dehydrogenase Mo-binding subunit
VDVGQGVHTALQQIAAETLGVEPGQVRINLVDTATVPDAGSSSASRHTYASGNAVFHACRLAREKWQQALREETGQTRVAASYTFHGRDARPTTPFAPETGQCEPHISYSFGTQVALVEVDSETGEVEVLKMWASNNAGRIVNPEMAFGQVAGGVHMGVGYALTEHYIQEEGYPRTRRFSEYAIPSVRDMPGELVDVPVEVIDPSGPLGATGLGETPTLSTAPAILNAIARATGARITGLPATPERVWRMLKEKEGANEQVPAPGGR